MLNPLMIFIKNRMILVYYIFLIGASFAFVLIVSTKNTDQGYPYTMISLPSDKIIVKNIKTSIKQTENGMIVVITSSDQHELAVLYKKISRQMPAPPVESKTTKLTNGILIELWGNTPEMIKQIKKMNLFTVIKQEPHMKKDFNKS